MLSRRAFLTFVAAGGTAAAVVPALTSCGFLSRNVDVLLIGDSIMNQTKDFVKPRLRRLPALDDVEVKAQAVNGSGLLTPKIYDWKTKASELIERYEPAAVVVLFVGNYTETDLWLAANGTYVPNDYQQLFYDEWRKQAEELTEILRRRGAQVWWVLPPPFYGPEGQRREGLLRETYLQLARDLPGVGLVDGRAALGGPNGEFEWNLPSIDNGEIVTVRQGDSLHLTPDGGKRMASAIADAIAPYLIELRRSRANA
ncbi:MAG: twin-arginine translocation signal domain-containing protein [Acidimicrobiales bacterium]|nr:twin-arginine translocation signal domain-containing protein [Acidimicrobiales bacterium]